ncbi:MAG: PQQ-dependent sugar dehydrogenase [Rhodobacteraceae bacterium]|nr:PQQ-dependent sugar dehydrogenase [Paracoccaceae bacterium]
MPVCRSPRPAARRRAGPSAVALGIALGLAAAPALAETRFAVETVVDALRSPWAIAFLPEGDRLLVTERTGSLRLVTLDSGAVAEIAGVPEVVADGQGGLLDIALHPDFPAEPYLYLTWTGADAEGRTATHVGRAPLDLEAMRLGPTEVLFVALPAFPSSESRGHFGSRIAFADGLLFVGFGDRQFKDFGPDHIAQDLSSANGAVIRLTPEGAVPPDNPFVGTAGAEPAIWSYGHRNVQAMAVHPETGALWVAEHGEAGGDEINIIERGANYGWPLAGYGVDYRTGRQISSGHDEIPGVTAPVFHWGPGRADNFPPSGMVFYRGEAFPEWQGRLLIGNLAHRYLGLFEVAGESVSPPERLLEGQGWRIRDVAVGPADGFVYVIADGPEAPLIRLVPADADG